MSTDHPPTTLTDRADDRGTLVGGRIPPPVVVAPAQLLTKTALLAGLGAVVLGVCWILAPHLIGGAGVVVAVLVGVFLWHRRRRHLRAVATAQATNSAQMALRGELRLQVWWTWSWGVGGVRKVVVRYDPTLLARLQETLASQLVKTLTRALGVPLQVKVNKQVQHKMVLVPVVRDTEVSALDLATARVKQVAGQIFGPTAAVRVGGTADDEVREFTVQHTVGAKLASESVQQKITMVTSAMLPGRWKATYRLETDEVDFSWRPPLPTRVDRDVPALDPSDPMYSHIPQGVDEDGEVVTWDISGQMAHMLKAGRTRTGKTVSLIGDAIEVAYRHFQVYVCDPKRNEFLGLRGWPNVRLVATRVADQVAMITYLHQLMEERYRQVEDEGALEDDFDRVVLIIDEYRLFYANVRAWWANMKTSGMPAQCPVFESVGALLRAAAACKINVILATQRPDAEFLSGEVRDNFSARGATGRLSPDGAKMMYDSHYVGTAIPMSVRGRGTIIGLDDKPREIQYIYTPDPRKARQRGAQDELDLLEKLKPATTTWSRQKVWIPELGELDSDEQDRITGSTKLCAEWELTKLATIVDYDDAERDDAENAEGAEVGELEASADPDEGEVLDEHYGPAEAVAVATVPEGWLAQLDDEGTWVVVIDCAVSDTDEDMIAITWHGEDDTTGIAEISADERVQARPPRDTGEEEA